MTRRAVTLAALIGITAAAIALDATDWPDQDTGSAAAPAIPVPAAPVDSGTGAAGPVDAGPVDAGGAADGDLGDQSVPVDSGEPAVTRLNPELLGALRDAARTALDEGVEMRVTSGWRTRDYQQRLLDEAIATYGSRQEALRWVATPDTSAHTTGNAVDVGPTDAAYWMSENGSAFGLCQTYANEIWHYELLTSPGGTCPTPLADGNS